MDKDMLKFEAAIKYNFSICGRGKIHKLEKNGYFLDILIGNFHTGNSDPCLNIEMNFDKYDKIYIVLFKGEYTVFELEEDKIKEYLEKEKVSMDKVNIGCYVNYDQLKNIYTIMGLE